MPKAEKAQEIASKVFQRTACCCQKEELVPKCQIKNYLKFLITLLTRAVEIIADL